MAEVIDVFFTFVRDNPVVVLGIIALGGLYLLLDTGMTLLCPVDQVAMKRVDGNSFRCGKCGFVKKV